jgi:hypothetical protein
MKKKIIVRSPCLSQSGYGEQARFALRALRSKEDLYDIYALPINWGQTGWIWEDNEERRWLDEIITKTAIYTHQGGQFDLSLQVTIPNEWERIAPVNIGYTAGIETTQCAPEWIEKANMMDRVVVVSSHARESYKGQDLNTKIDVVNYSYRHHESEPIEQLDLKTDFNFLCVSQWGPRKNFENTVKWWVEEFIDMEVGLVLKTNIKNNSQIDVEFLERNLKNMLSEYPDRKCKVYVLHGDLTDGQMAGLYQNPKIKALINIAHGEGFGLPMFEAAYNELPIITIGWSGQLDYLFHDGRKFFSDVKYTMQPIQREAVWPGVVDENSMWAYADQGAYKMKLRDMYKKHSKHLKRSKELKKIILENFTEEEMYSKFCDSLVNIEDVDEVIL